MVFLIILILEKNHFYQYFFYQLLDISDEFMVIAFGVTTQRLKNTDLILVNNNLTLRKNQNMCLVSGFQSESSLSKPVSEGTVLYVGRSTDRLILRDKKKMQKIF